MLVTDRSYAPPGMAGSTVGLRLLSSNAIAEVSEMLNCTAVATAGSQRSMSKGLAFALAQNSCFSLSLSFHKEQ
jgi:hypothetical protein